MRLKLLLVTIALFLGFGTSYGQTSTQNFGTGTGSQTSQTGSSSFLPNPTSGTTWGRGGATSPSAPVALANTSNPLGTTGSYVRAVASSTTSVSKFSPWVVYTGGTEFYTSFKVLFGDSSAGNTATSGIWNFYQGAGAMYSDANEFAGAQVFTGLRFTYGASGAIALTYRGGAAFVNTSLTTSTFSSGTVYTVEIMGNNKTSGTINYTYSGVSQTVAIQKFDLYINGVLIGDDLAEAALPANTTINSGTFIGINSASNVANVFVDDAITYNTIPAAIGVSGITSKQTGNWSDSNTWAGLVVPTSTDNAVIANGHIVTMDTSTGGINTRNFGTSTTVNVGGTLATSVQYINNGTTTVNGTFQLNAGGYTNSGNNFIYGTAGTLNFNNTSSYGVNTSDQYWPTTSGPFNVNVLQGGVTLNSANRTVAGTFATASGVTLTSSTLTLSGTNQINAGGYFNQTPTYSGSTSTLIYNNVGAFNITAEWTGGGTTSPAVGSGVPGNVTIQLASNIALAGARGVPGNINIVTSGSSVLTLNNTSGDLYLGGNLTQNNGAAGLINNSRAVYFIGSSPTQTINATTSPVYFDYFIIDKPSGKVQLSGTDVTINTASGNVFQILNAGSLDLNGRALTFNNAGGSLYTNGTGRTISSTLANATVNINANKSVGYNNSGTDELIFGTGITVHITNAVIDFGAGKSYINGTLQLNQNGGVTNAPIYGNVSTLKYWYNGASVYGRYNEWNATGLGTIGTTKGYPNNVQISNTTVLDLGANGGSGTARAINGNLTIDDGSEMRMSGTSAMSQPLTVGGDLIVGQVGAATLNLSGTFGGDLKVGGDIYFNTNYNFNPNNRAVYFIKNGVQKITAPLGRPSTFNYVFFDPAAGSTTVQLVGADMTIAPQSTGDLLTFKSANDIFDINGRTLTLGNASNTSTNAIAGLGAFKGSTTSNLTLLGKGSIGTLNFTTGSQVLGNLTLNREASKIGFDLGTDVSINGVFALTNGIANLSNYTMLITLAGTITGASSSNYIIADFNSGVGSGILRKNVSATYPSFTFPIGDSSGSANGSQYSPATIIFNSATYGLSYIALSVEDLKEPNDSNSTTDYITRYWNLTSNITSAVYDFSGTFLPADVIGTDSNCISGRYSTSNSSWTNGNNVAAGLNTISFNNLTSATGALTSPNHFTAGYRNQEINIKENSTSVVYGSGGTAYDFGNVVSGVTKTITFKVENLGQKNLILGTASLTGNPPYTTNYTYTNGAPLTISGLNSSTFTITFSPTSIGTFTGSVSIVTNDSNENPYVINFTGVGIRSAASDLFYTTSSSPATISSTMQDSSNLTSTTGVKVMEFSLRDGGGTTDADNLPTILTGFTIAQSSNTASNWSTAIKTIALFDGSTRLANGTITATTITFSGLSISTLIDGGSKTLSLRMSLNCSLGTNVDGEYFGFSIANGATTVDSSGSGMTTFAAVQNAPGTGSTLKIDVIATKLLFKQEPSSIGVGNPMANVIVAATDDCGNIDRDKTGSILLTSSGTMTGTTLSANLSSGIATFIGIVHTVIQSGLQLTANLGSFNSESIPFNITTITVFSQGDFAVVGVNSNISLCNGAPYTGGEDEVSFMTFQDIQNGDVFYISDNGYERITAGLWGDTEGVYKITRNGVTIPAGTVITFRFLNASPFMEFSSPDVLWTFTKAPGFTGNLVLNSDGDQLFFMQGGTWNNPSATAHDATYKPGATGSLLYAFNTNNIWKPFSDFTKDSGLPIGLRCFSLMPGSSTDYLEYTGPVTIASKLDWIARLNNPSNWTDRVNCAGYTRMHVDKIYPITTGGTYVDGVWTGSKSTDWFDCGNWQTLKVPDQTTNVDLNLTTATKDAVIDITSSNASIYSNIAKSNNLSISNKKVQIQGSSSNILEVSGNISINTSGAINMDDTFPLTPDGVIKLKGNWTNSIGESAFQEGNGTVQFAGTSPQIINNNVHSNPEQFYNVILDNNFKTIDSNNLIVNGDLTINNGKTVIVSPNDYLKVQNGLTNNGTVTINDSGSLVQVNDAAVNTGNITYERNYKGIGLYDYTYWSSPVAGQNLFALSPTTKLDKFFSFDADITVDWKLENPITTTMDVGKGYIIRSAPWSGVPPGFLKNSFVGVPNNGEKLVPIYWRNGDTLGTSNLIGNPYPSAIDAVKFLNANTGAIESTIYFWTNATDFLQSPSDIIANGGTPGSGALAYTSNDYASFNLTGGVAVGNTPLGTLASEVVSNRPNGIIAAGQAFFTTSLKANGNDVIFNNSMRLSSDTVPVVLDNSQFFKTKNPKSKTEAFEKHRIWLNLTNTQGLFKQTLVGYITDATNEYDSRFDGESFDGNEFADFYSINQEKNLVIQGRALPFDENDEVSLGFRTTIEGAFTIKIDQADGVLTNQAVFIEDKLTNSIFDLRSGSFTFNTAAGTFNDRFVLRYTNKTLGTKDLVTLENQVLVSSKNKQIKVNSAVEIIDKVTVYDLLGRQLFKKDNVSSNELAIPNLVSSQQTLLVKVILQNGQTVTKKIMY